MTEPIIDNQEAPNVSAAVTAVKAIVDNAKPLGLTWTLRPGAVTEDSPLTESTASVTLDGDTVVLSAVSLVGPLLADQRVMVMLVPPAGMFIIGSAAHDRWHFLDESGEPEFNTNWSNFGSGFGSVGFRRTLDGHLELTGMADFAVTATSPNLVFVLPEGWRPDRTINLITSNNPNATTTPTPRGIQINTDGEVYIVHYTGTIDPGPISFDGIYLPLRTGG